MCSGTGLANARFVQLQPFPSKQAGKGDGFVWPCLHFMLNLDYQVARSTQQAR